MIEICVNADDIARVRFTSDATWEAMASLCAVSHPARHPLHARLAQLIPDHPAFDMELLLELTQHARWQPDLLAPTPLAKPAAVLDQFAALPDRVPAEVLEADLDTLRCIAPTSRAAGMAPDELIERTAAALAGYWRAVLAPLWDRVEALISGEIARCSLALATEGLASALSGLHTLLCYDAGVLRVATPAHAITSAAEGAGLWFLPSVFKWPGIAVDPRGASPVICYAARGSGLVWDCDNADQPDGLTQLIGQSRARILAVLDVPRGTTAIAAMLDLSPGTVSAHLSILSAAGLLMSWREGRRVLYSRTDLAATMLGRSAGDDTASRTTGTSAWRQVPRCRTAM